MEAKKSLVCKCGKQAKFIQMHTFSYHYCELCKDEVKDEPKKSEKVVGWDSASALYGLTYDQFKAAKVQASMSGIGVTRTFTTGGMSQQPASAPSSALPPGYVALKGEQVTCDTCGHLKFFLPCDLSSLVSVAQPWGNQDERYWPKEISDEVNVWTPNVSAMDCVCTRCYGGAFADRDDGTLHIKGRGWV